MIFASRPIRSRSTRRPVAPIFSMVARSSRSMVATWAAKRRLAGILAPPRRRGVVGPGAGLQVPFHQRPGTHAVVHALDVVGEQALDAEAHQVAIAEAHQR